MEDPVDPRLVQLSRILKLPLATETAAQAAVSARPGQLADQLFLEAAASDDVTSADAAIAYLQLRLNYFGGLVTAAAASAIRARFAERVAAW
ncbi:MAG: hypothetical protein ABI782_00010 [Anaerolineaceae bacterium]